jgi:hypothetical protein
MASFAKRPPGQTRAPPFYWRGGDVLTEQEFLRDEHRLALIDLRLAQQTLVRVNADVAEASSVHREREGYTNALAAFLEQDVSCAKQETEMRDRLRKLEGEIDLLHTRLTQLRGLQNPAAAGSLQKEKGYYWIEIQRGQQEIQTNVDKGNEAKRQMAACTVNKRYRDAIRLADECRRLTEKRQRLRVMTRQAQLQFQAMHPTTPLVDAESRAEREALRNSIEAHIDLMRMEDRSICRKAKRRAQLEFFIRQVEELNGRMKALGVTEGVVDAEEIRARMIPGEGRREEEEVPEQTFHTRLGSRNTYRVQEKD